MGEPESYVSSSHTVAELKAMCKENGLAINGKKADLIARLNKFFTDDSPAEEESISLEEEESISIEEEIVSLESESVPLPEVNDVLDAEVLDAEFVEVVEPTYVKESKTSATLIDQLKNPKVAAVLLTIIIASGGWYWYCLLYTSDAADE